MLPEIEQNRVGKYLKNLVRIHKAIASLNFADRQVNWELSKQRIEPYTEAEEIKCSFCGKPSTNSISEGQVLSCPYEYSKARIIVQEMADSLVLQLTDKGLVTDSLTLDVGYDRENCDNGTYHGPVHIDHYGRTVPKGAHGSVRLDNPTNLGSQLIKAAATLFDQITDKTLTVRRITIAANRVVKDEGIFQVDLFTDTSKLEKEKKLQDVMLGIKKKFGNSCFLK